MSQPMPQPPKDQAVTADEGGPTICPREIGERVEPSPLQLMLRKFVAEVGRERLAARCGVKSVTVRHWRTQLPGLRVSVSLRHFAEFLGHAELAAALDI